MSDNFTPSKLNFEDIKESLKTYFKNTGEYNDYDFEGSGMNTMMDVLSYNTHLQAMYANFAVNESFLDTAQLRSSVVSHAKPLNYVPRSVRSSRALVRVTLQGSPSGDLVLPRYLRFTAASENKIFTFYTLDEYSLNVANNYTADIFVYEGKKILKRFIVDSDQQEYPIYVIPDDQIDTTTMTVVVKGGLNATVQEAYKIPKGVEELVPERRNYFIHESANNYYEIMLGDNLIGFKPPEGSVIDIEYLKASGTEGNRITEFKTAETINGHNISISTIEASYGGAEKESIASIKFNAPKAFAAQNRAVTPNDYKMFIKSEASFVESLNVWGGETNTPPDYGSVFISIKPFDRVEMTSIEEAFVRDDILEPRAVLTIEPRFVAPEFQYIEVKVNARYDGTKTPFTKSQLENRIKDTIQDFSQERLVGFEALFRKSRLLGFIDDSDEAIVSVDAQVSLQRRLIPELNVARRYDLRYSLPFAPIDSRDHILTSDTFEYIINGISYPCTLRNQKKSLRLEIIRAGASGEIIVVDDAGFIDTATNTVTLLPFRPSSVPNINEGIRFSIKPADENAIYPQKNLLIDIDPVRTAVNAIEEFEQV